MKKIVLYFYNRLNFLNFWKEKYLYISILLHDIKKIKKKNEFKTVKVAENRKFYILK